jgi:hypothetical protein
MAKELGSLPAAVQTWHLEWLSEQLVGASGGRKPPLVEARR